MGSVVMRGDPEAIVPIEPAGVLADHALIVDGGTIVAVVASARADQEYAARERVALPGKVLLPGLINAHTHSPMTLFRGIADDVALQVWLEREIWPREGKHVAPEFVYDGSRLAAVEMLAGGTTCFHDMYFFPDATAKACLETGIRAVLGLPVLDFPTSYASDADRYLNVGLAVRDAYKASPRLGFSLAPHAPYTVSDATFDKIVMFARQLDLPITTHVAETAAEVAVSIERYGISPLARLHKLGVTGPGFIGVHGVHLSASDIDLLATHGGSIVHCPVSNMKLGSGIAPVPALLARGINVAIGTDGAASNNRQDSFSEMRIAALLAKVASGDASLWSAQQVLESATLGGARALGLDARLGSLVPGKCADVIAVDLSAMAALPCYDPRSHLVHVAGRESVTDVWIDGERVVEDRRVSNVDQAQIAARARAWQEKLR